MPRTISDSLNLLKTSLGEIRTKLETKIPSGGGILPQQLKVSEVAPYIQQISTGNQLQIQVNGTGFPEGTTFTARHTDGTEVSGESPLTVTKAGTWTVTDSFSSFSDSVAVSDTFPVSHTLPKITVTTDIGNGNIQTATCGQTKLEATVGNGKAVFYVPKTGTWVIGYAGSEETVSVSVSARTDYTATYEKETKLYYDLKITNASNYSKFYCVDLSKFANSYKRNLEDAYENNTAYLNPFDFGSNLAVIDNSSKQSTVNYRLVVDKDDNKFKDWMFLSHEEKYLTDDGGEWNIYKRKGVIVKMGLYSIKDTIPIDYSKWDTFCTD